MDVDLISVTLKRAAIGLTFIFVSICAMAQNHVTAPGSDTPTKSSMKPPQARTETVVDDYHGHKIADPYRWLENAGSPETQKFVEEQNAYTRRVLDSTPVDKNALRSRIEQLLTIGRVDPPRPAGNYYFYTRRDGRQNQPVLYVREGLNGKDRPLVDVNALAPDGTIALDWFFPSDDGKYLAYGTSPNGSEISTLEILETTTGKHLPEKIGRTRAASVAWLPDNSGFYYTRYPRPGDVPAGQEMYNRHVFLHKFGDPANADGLKDPQLFPFAGESVDPQSWPNIRLSNDGKCLIVKLEEGWAKSELYIKNLGDPSAALQKITTGKEFLYDADAYNGQLYIVTNDEAPRFRVMKADCAHPQRENWREIVPQSEAVLEEAPVTGGRLFLRYTHNAASELKIADLDGKHLADVRMPMLGSIYALGGDWSSKEGFMGFTSFAVPTTVYQVNFDGKISIWAGVESNVDPNRYEVKQVWFNSKDGTRVPMFLVNRKGIAKNGKTPTLLSGYGGFNVGRLPVFDRNAMLVLLEHGGIYADVQLRGGNEFGEDWHTAGMLEKKQNVFDDFIAAAEYLISEKYTDKDHLAIQGGSNGGLLMGAALTQRPDLFRAVICQVPLLDMLRYQNFQIAKLWIPEYGSAENPAQFNYIYAYSPYQHVKKGTVYPATFFMTADSDTRVDPMHAKKMAALMQADAPNGADRPILLRVDTKAGHGVGKPIAKLVEDNLDLWTFLFWQLGLK
ncbi:MAG TPA: prolyl oligopeptidase family serine peptidase [Candidatus Limnocylindrales bacterium]|nr:prolyl oligopeptidase family serine peptidase [Candidatus Limnocylindrales bacterium]